MRPRRLEVAAFGPFAGTEAVDFDALADSGLFLVTGPTGAGKTFLLDALSYALYGKVPGSRRPERLRSDHAPMTLETEVACEFSLRGEDWRVTRKPPHERARRRGGGTTTQKPTATLSRRGPLGWEPVASGVEEVNGTVAAMLGLDAEQFAQVVVLPQGDVQRALTADARDRERLLSSLFATGRFAALTQRLADRARELAWEVALDDERAAAVRAEAAVHWREVTGGDGPGEEPADVHDLEGMAARAADAAAAATATADQARAHARAAAGRLRRGAVEAARWRRRDEARERLAALDAEQDDVDRARREVARAQAAAPCRPLLDDAAAAAARLAEATSARDTRLRALPAGAAVWAPFAAAGDAGAALSRAEVDAALQDVRAAKVRVQQVLPLAGAAQEARDRAAEAERKAGAEEEAAEAALASAGAAEAEAARREEDLIATREAAGRLEGQRAEAERLAAVAQAAAAAADRSEAWRCAREVALAAAERAAAAQQAHLDLVRRSLDGMAGTLARGLEPGRPCAVCGSEEHPDPAPDADGVGPEAVRAAEAEAERARAEADAAADEREAARAALERARAAAGGAEVDPSDAASRAEAAAEAAEATAAEAAGVDGLAAEVDRLRGRARDDRDRAGEHRRRAGVARAEAAAAGAQADADEARLREALGGGGDARAVAAAIVDVEAALVTLEEAVAAAERAGAEAAASAERAAAQAVAQGFADPGDARAALRDPASLVALGHRVEEHGAARRVAEATLADPEIASLAGEPPDVAALERDAEDAAAAAEDAARREAAVRRAAEALDGLAGRLAAMEATAGARRETGERVRRLADVCRGSGNARRMSLERYVLAAALEDVTARASLRLAAMTDGRYTLRHSDERARNNAASGLAILVCDAYTGVERDVGSLSGGETFQAALALALGIADAVASRGAVRLDTLFVDEGFGSLDADALEQAMTELDRLREGGRMVGVVSHVPGLRERIPTGLRVVRTRAGSRVEPVTDTE